MAITHTNRKGQIYTLYQGQTKTGKPRYYFARTEKIHDEPVTELPAGFTISESINGVVSLVKDRPVVILPEEVAVVEEVVRQHPKARQYRVAVKDKRIEIYEQVGPNFETLSGILQPTGRLDPGLAERMYAVEKRSAHYMPVMCFNLLDPAQRLFGVERMCYRSSVDGWLELIHTGSVATLAQRLIPTLDTDEFYELL
jgi:hypothetical protein